MRKAANKKPNIVIVYADQMRYDAMSPSGNPVVKTPHLQRLADEGACFDDAFTSYPLCCPFRASMMTGKYAQGHGMYQNHFPLNSDQEFLGERMKDAGYQTMYVGKWHLEGGPKPGFVPPDRRFGFDKFVGFNRGHHYLDGIFWRDTDQPYRCQRYEPDYQTDHLLEFIDEARTEDPDKPFLAYISYGPPHHPNEMPEHWRKMYDPAEVDLRHGVLAPQEQAKVQQERLQNDCEGNLKAAHTSRCAYNQKPQMEPETEEEQRTFIAEYYGMISCIDHNVGRVLGHLDKLGIADDTMVIFLSDHGDMLGEHGYFCGIKPQGYRAAMQVPLLIRYPGMIAGGLRVSELVDVGVDTPVTLLDLVGAEAFSEADGVSYLQLFKTPSPQPLSLIGRGAFAVDTANDGVLNKNGVVSEQDTLELGTANHPSPPGRGGEGEATRTAVMYQTFRMNDGAKGEFTPKPERGIRTKDWLYVRQPEHRKYLFDQQADPHELNNLVNDAAYSDLMDEFDAQITAHMEATGDAWDLHLDFPPPDFLTHEAAKDQLVNELLPRAILVP